jgi:hypothetical protein
VLPDLYVPTKLHAESTMTTPCNNNNPEQQALVTSCAARFDRALEGKLQY